MAPQQPEIARSLKKALRLDPERLADLTGDRGGGVAGRLHRQLVSAQGLVVTNHHCAQQHQLIDPGTTFRATVSTLPRRRRTAGPNARIVLDAITDVSERDAAIAPPMGRSSGPAPDAIEKRLVAEREAEPGYRCRLYSFPGTAHRLFRNPRDPDASV